MKPMYVMNCEKYAGMADKFYEQYLDAQEKYDSIAHDNVNIEEEIEKYAILLELSNLMDTSAIASIVFEALAIEAYINLFGVYQLGEAVFFSEYEPPKANKPKNFKYYNTTDKLKKICRESIEKEYPNDSIESLCKIFEKRDRLVHSKPRPYYLEKAPYNYDNPGENYKDIQAVFDEFSFVFEDIDAQMNLYKQLKENIKNLRGADKELVEEIRCNMLKEIAIAESEMIIQTLE